MAHPKVRSPRSLVRGARAPAVPLVGRDASVEEIAAAVRSGARILSIVGPGGIGKTSVAVACLERLAPTFERAGGTWFCDLTEARSEADLLFALLSLVGGEASPGQGELLDRAAAALGDLGRALVVLDNFEQLTGVAAALLPLLASAPELTFLVTSRERLGIRGERTIELPPLACPPAGATHEEAEVTQAVRLFLSRARDAGGGGESDALVVGAIVRRLDGIPLAIELAAARTRVMPAPDLLERLTRGLDVLAAKPGTTVDRHATLENAIAWSWELLIERERLALARSTVFAGSFTVDAAEAITSATIEDLASLRDKSLLRNVDGRLSLYVSVREYAAARLPELGDPIKTRRAHALFFAELASRFNAERVFQGRSVEPGLVMRLRAEKENLVAALALAARDDASAEARVELALAVAHLHALPRDACLEELTAALFDAERRGRHSDMARLLLARQHVHSELGDHAACLRDLAAVQALPDVPDELRAVALLYVGVAERNRGRLPAALAAHTEARRRMSGDRMPRLRVANEACLGRLHGDLGDTARAVAANREAIDVSEAIGDWTGALARANLAQVAQEQQDFAQAEGLLAQALDRLRAVGELHHAAVYVIVTGDLAFERGDVDAARRCYAEGAEHFRPLVGHRQSGVVHAAAAALEAGEGNLALAGTHLEAARLSASRARNPVVDAIVAIHGAAVELARAPESARERVARETKAWAGALSARGAAGADDPVTASVDVRFALRMLDRAADRALRAAASPSLVIAADGRWFSFAGRTVDLARRAALRGILTALADAREGEPGRGVGVAELVARGWPGERILATAAATRVRVAVATLRSLGLRDALITRDDGYTLDERVRVERRSTPCDAF